MTLGVGDAATCTITNPAIAPTLTLAKTVSNNYGGTAVATDWTLTGAGPVTINGATGSAQVTAAVVQVGDYNLSEAGGPGGYTPSDWDCGDADLTGSTVTVPLAANVTCSIVNSDQPAHLTRVKVVDAADTGTTHVPADWTLTATPQGITGQDPVVSGNGDPTTPGGVDAVEVFAGDYQLSESGPAGFEGSARSALAARWRRSRTGPERRQRHLHNHQHCGRPDADPGEADQRPRQRRYRCACRLDVDRHRSQHYLRGDRVGHRHQCGRRRR